MRIYIILVVFLLIHFKTIGQVYLYPIIGIDFDLIDEKGKVNEGNYGSFDVNSKLYDNSSMTLGVGVILDLNNNTYLNGNYSLSMPKRANALLSGFVPRQDISYMKQSFNITFHSLINEYFSIGSGLSLNDLTNIKTFYYSGGSEKFHNNIHQIGIPLQIALLYKRFELRFNYTVGVLNLTENPFKPIQSIGLSSVYRFRINIKSKNVECPKMN